MELPERLAVIAEKLARLRALDVRFEVRGAGGSNGHHYVGSPPLDDASLARLETSLGTTLPEELRAFVQTIHGGVGPGPGDWFFSVDTDTGPRAARPWPYGAAELAELHARRESDPYASLEMVESELDGDQWPPGPGFIALADHGCGITDALVVTGELRGTMWCCDMAWRPYDCGFLDWYERWLDANLLARRP